jgi:DNA-binding transcriptional regulator YhcF (GntR family)
MSQAIVINIDQTSRIPKYKQIVDSIINDISKGKLKVGEKIPSINKLSETCDLSRDTVEKAYKQLKERKVIISVKGKGFYTAKTDLISKVNVFFLINKLSSYKMMVYNSFVNSLGINGHVNLSIYHCEESLFVRAIEKNIGAYDYYIIMPHFKNEQLNHLSYTNKVLEVIERIPKDKLIIMDNNIPEIKGNFGLIYQDFKNDIYHALIEGIEKFKKYDKLILVYPTKSVYPFPKRILIGFRQFCVEYNLDFEILDEIYEDMELQSKDLYITIEETDLVNLVRQIRMKGLKLGKDVGIISYNDTPLKDLLGITVVSTNFKAMGETAADFVLKNKNKKLKTVFSYIERNSV